jgi:UDP-N-acetylmuramate dehydrogenase
MLSILQYRRRKFPLKMPSCGSVFLSAVDKYGSVVSPGKVIEYAGLKGLRCGGAEVSHKHANFILNSGNAKSQDVIELIKVVKGVVCKKTGVLLECEVKYIDDNGKEQPDIFKL